MKKRKDSNFQNNEFVQQTYHLEDEDDITSYSNNADYQNNNSSSYKKNERMFKDQLKDEKKRLKYVSRKNRRFFNIFGIFMFVIVSFIISQFFMTGVSDMLAMNRKSEVTTSISIPSNASYSEISHILKNSGVINSESWFNTYLNLFKSSQKFTKGDYEIRTNMEYEEIISYLNTQSNRNDTVNVTFAEGLSVLDYANLLQENNVCDKNEFLQKCNSTEFDTDYSFLSQMPISDKYYYRLEGYLYPDTYKFYQDENVNEVIEKMLSNFKSKIIDKTNVTGYKEKVSIEKAANDSGFTLHELITLASIVQAEAADEEDMRIISSIFLNRLNSDESQGLLCLNSDATAYYPYKSKSELPKNFKSRYDTNTVQGLPLGAIRNPGLEVINAVLNHDDTNYMYFCHDKNGKAYYATTLTQHTNNMIKAGIDIED